VTRTLLASDREFMFGSVRTVPGADPDYEIVGEVCVSSRALSAVGRLRPDLVVIHLSLPRVESFPLASLIASRHPRTKIVVLGLCEDASSSGHGAYGYVVTRGAPTTLAAAIGRAAARA
jgi:DNA-binding NarL/FixJ family response regulator